MKAQVTKAGGVAPGPFQIPGEFFSPHAWNAAVRAEEERAAERRQRERYLGRAG
jgi:hypothetical protein